MESGMQLISESCIRIEWHEWHEMNGMNEIANEWHEWDG